MILKAFSPTQRLETTPRMHPVPTAARAHFPVRSAFHGAFEGLRTEVEPRLESIEGHSRDSLVNHLLKDAEGLVRGSVFPLEMALIGACSIELAHDRQLGTPRDFEQDPTFFEDLRRRVRIDDLEAVIDEYADRIAALADSAPNTAENAAVPLATAVRYAKKMVAACPITLIEQAAETTKLEKLGHRCRVAFEGLRAFIRRADPERRERLSVLGQLYAEAKISLSEVAKVLDVERADAIAELEEAGHWRAPEALVLESDEERVALLAKVREDRLRRGGAPEPSDERAARSVIASSRIESVDARRWIPGNPAEG